MKYIVILFVCLFAAIAPAREIFTLASAEVPPIIDGHVAADEWTNATWFTTFYQVSPGDNTAPSEKTEAAIWYDEENIYLMAKLYFADGENHRDFRCSRDAIYTSDRLYFYLDTYLSNSQAFYVGCNANGEQADGLMKNNETDPTIDLFYTSRAEKTDWGFSMELKVPLKSLNYQSGDDVQWGFFIKRLKPEGAEEICSFPVNRDVGNFYQNYGIITFSHLPEKRSLKIIPAVVNVYTKNNDNVTGTQDADNDIQPELNIFWEPNSHLTATATINPDFNIIEADGVEITVNNRFPSFYSEKRPFFIESRNPFSTNITIYHTRNIVNPTWATKLSGQYGASSFFALAAQDENAAGERFGSFLFGKTSPAYFGFGAWKYQLNENGSFVRGAATLRSFEGYENLVGSADWYLRLNDTLESKLQFSASSTELPQSTHLGSAFNGKLSYYTPKWYLKLEHKAIEPRYQADLGYVSQTDIQETSTTIERHGNATSDENLWRYWETAYSQDIKWNYQFDRITEQYHEVKGGLNTQLNLNFWNGLERTMLYWNNQRNWKWFYWNSLDYNPFKEVGVNFTWVTGEDFWLWSDTVEMQPFHKYEPTLFLRPFGELDVQLKARYHELEECYIARSYEAMAKVQFHRSFWLRLIAQVQNIDVIMEDRHTKSFAIYPLFTYQPNSRTSFYAGASTQDDQGTSWEFDNGAQQIIHFDTTRTTWFFKISYTFDII